MDKSLKKLIIMVSILVVLIVTFVILKNVDFSEKSKEKQYTVLSVPMDDISAYSYSFKTSELDDESIVEGKLRILTVIGSSLGELVSLVKEDDGVWYFKEDKTVPINQEMVRQRLLKFESITTNKVITEPQDLSEYGFDDLNYYIEITLKSGEKKCIEIGAKNEIKNYYYMHLVGDSNVYFVDNNWLEYFKVPISDFVVEPEATPSDATEDE